MQVRRHTARKSEHSCTKWSLLGHHRLSYEKQLFFFSSVSRTLQLSLQNQLHHEYGEKVAQCYAMAIDGSTRCFPSMAVLSVLQFS